MDLPAPATRLTPARVVLILTIVVLLGIAVFAPVPRAIRGQGILALLNFAHFVLAAGACWFLAARMGWTSWAAFLAVVAAAALCEILQGFTGRCPAMTDFVRGLFGAMAGLICLSAFRASVPTARWISASLVVVAVSAWPVSEFLLATARLCLRVTSWVS